MVKKGLTKSPTKVPGLHTPEPCVVGKGLAGSCRESYLLEDLDRSLMAVMEGH